jgi:hypothetical protein
MGALQLLSEMMPVSLRTLVFPWIEVVRHLLRPLMLRREESMPRLFLPLIAVIFVTWIVTVPVHEFMHAAGCVLFGGSVDELTIQPMYGGEFLAKIFPFVKAGGNYAGQLTEFDTGGSDVCYFATDFFPFLLSIFFGVPLLVIAARKRSTVLHGIGFVQIMVPIVSIPGDFYEMGSILITRSMDLPPQSAGAELIRGDDVFVVLDRVRESAEAVGISHGVLAVVCALFVGLIFHIITLDLSLLIARTYRGVGSKTA